MAKRARRLFPSGIPRDHVFIEPASRNWREPRALTKDEGLMLVNRLTPKERQVGMAYAEGYKRAQVAEMFDMEPVTVDTHVIGIGKRIGVHGRLAIAMLFWMTGLVEPTLHWEPSDPGDYDHLSKPDREAPRPRRRRATG